MIQIIVTLDSPEIEALEKQGDKELVAKVQHSKLDRRNNEFGGI